MRHNKVNKNDKVGQVAGLGEVSVKVVKMGLNLWYANIG